LLGAWDFPSYCQFNRRKNNGALYEAQGDHVRTVKGTVNARSHPNPILRKIADLLRNIDIAECEEAYTLAFIADQAATGSR
jgi:hypothetical protein